MPLSTDVNLPKSHVRVFPDRCVACGVAEPRNMIRVGTNAIGWWTLAFWTFGSRFSVDVPACDSCRGQMLLQRWVRRLLTWAFAIVGVAIAVYILTAYGGPFKRWLALGIALACCSPYFVWEVFFPPPVDLTAYSKTVDYEFRNAEYAAEFAALNRTRAASDETE